MKIIDHKRGSVLVLEILGKITRESGCQELEAKLKDHLDRGERLFVLNMLGVPYVDTRALALVVACHGWVREHGGSLTVVNSHPVQGIFEMTGFDTVFGTFRDEDEALASLEGLVDVG